MKMNPAMKQHLAHAALLLGGLTVWAQDNQHLEAGGV